MRRFAAFILALAIMLPIGFIVTPETTVKAGVNTNGHATLNEGVYAVPTPDKVTVDGNFDEWDWSGRIQMYKDYDYKDVYYSEMAAMWDEEALYLGFKFTDNSPMLNTYDPELEPSWTWRGDAIQLRFITDRKRGWFTFAPYTQKDIGSMHVAYPLEGEEVGYATAPGGSVLNRITMEKGVPKAKQLDSEIKYKLWEEGGGYNVEMKLPWDLLYLAPNVGAGTVLQMGIENYWGDPTAQTNNEYSIFDNAQPGKNPGGYTSDNAWGNLTLLASGSLTQREYTHDSEVKINGTIHIQAKVPKNAKKVSLRIEDKYGEIISQQIAEVDVDKNSIIGEENGYYIVDTTWDGKDLMGDMVHPGEYTVTGIYHEGITPYFDASAYNPGNPPWPDSTGNGSWASDHLAPKAITAIGDRVFIGSGNTESGTGIFRIDNDGKKEWGIKRGAEILASNDKYIYSLPGNDFYADTTTTGNTYLMRVNAQTGSFAPFEHNGELRDLQYYIQDILGIKKGVMPTVTDMEANNDYIVIATKSNNDKIKAGYNDYGCHLTVLDPETGEVEKRIAVSSVGNIAFGDNGLLYAKIGNGISEVNIATGKITQLPIKEAEGEEFGAMDIDNDGNIVIYERGDRQLKVYGKNGNMLYAIGKKGGRAIVGKWEEDGLTHQVTAIAVDSKNQIWVVEHWNYPRRVSVWNKEGFVKDFIGNPGYMGAGGSLDEDDPNKVWVGPNEMVIDRDANTYEMVAVNWVPDLGKSQNFPINVIGNNIVQHFVSDAGGKERRFMYQCASDDNQNTLYVEVAEGEYRPTWSIGRVSTLWMDNGYGRYVPDFDSDVYREDKSLKPKQVFKDFSAMAEDTLYIWNDWNNDGSVSYSECEFYFPHAKNVYGNVYNIPNYAGWGNRMTKNMELVLTDRSDAASTTVMGCIVSPISFTEDGIPRYTVDSFKNLKTERPLFFGENVLLDDGKIVSARTNGGKSRVQYLNGIKCVDSKTGKDLWWYPNLWPGVHGSQISAVQKQGEVLGPIKCLGIVDSGDNTQTMCFRGNMGNDFLLTTDGYYVQTLFRDGRIPMLKLPDKYEDAEGIDMSKYSENGEPFSGIMEKHSDGKVRLLSSTAGPTIIIVRVEGLDTIRHLEPFKITVTQAMLDEADAWNKADHTQDGQENTDKPASKEIIIAKAPSEVTIDGAMLEWTGVPDITVAKDGVEEVGYVSLSYDDNNLYVAFSVTDKTPMVNNGVDTGLLFKTGDVCDIMLSPNRTSGAAAAEGDMRIMMSVFEGKPIAMLLKQVSTTKKERMYSSPVSAITFDYVDIIKDAEIEIVRDTGNGAYTLEAKIPLASIGLSPKAGESIIGDVGIVTSDEYGQQNKARVYFYNQNTGLVSDVPGEVRIEPINWGKVTFAK